MSNAYFVDNDTPENGSIVVRVYKPMGVQASVVGAPAKTVRWDAARLQADQAVQQQYYDEGGTGPVQGFNGPLNPVWITKTIPGNQHTVTTGIYGDSVEFQHFLSYEYAEDYLVPCDGFSFTLSQDELADNQKAVLIPGAKVEVAIDGNVQSVGYIDKIRVVSNRGSGSIVNVQCRHWLAPAIDAQVDPQTRFPPTMTLLDVVTATLAPFGMTVASTSNYANRNAITGAIYGTPTTKKGKSLKSFVLHQEKPYPREGAFEFCQRIANRFGVWIRAGSTFGEVVITEPDFDEDSNPARYTLHHKTDSSGAYNNVLESEVEWNREKQPSIIFGSGFGGGGDFAKSTLRGYIINPLVASSPSALAALVAKYPGIVQVPMDAVTFASGIGNTPIPDPTARPLYLYDSESHTQSQLESYLRRELSMKMREALMCHYVIEGHRIAGQSIAVDTLIKVDDDRAPLQQTLWIQKRRFSKTLGGGTTTEIDAILPGSIQFGPGGSQ